MAEIPINARTDQPHGGEHCVMRGDLVVAMPDGHEWGGEERPPKHVVVALPGVDADQVNDRLGAWTNALDVGVVARSLAQDGWRIRIFSTVPGAANEAGITRAQVEKHLTNWGAVVHSVAPNEIRFDWSIFEGLQSPHFWASEGASPVKAVAGIAFTETAYDQGTGVHTVEAVYDSLGLVRNPNIASRIVSHGGRVLDDGLGVISFELDRDTVKAKFLKELKILTERKVRMGRWSLPEADVALALAQGGRVEVTLAQLRSRLIDRAG